MKKSLVLMAMAGVALAGCVNDVAEVAQNQVQKKAYISFEAPVTYANGESRANFYGEIGIHPENDLNNDKFEGTYSYPTIENFVVFAKVYEAGKSWGNLADFWTNGTAPSLEVFYDAEHNGWSPTKKHAWPDEGSLVFAAYSPSDLKPYKSDNVATKGVGDQRSQVLEDGYTGNPTASVNNYGVGISNFKVADNPACQFDLLYTRITDPVNQNYVMNPSQGYYYGTTLVFNHALSSIHFTVKKPTALNANEIVLTGITLRTVKNKGGFAVNDPTNANPITWTLGNETHDYSVFTGTLEFPSDMAAHVGDNGGYPLLVLPQETDVVELYVTYTVDGEERECTVDLHAEKGQHGQQQITVSEWLPGYRYVYNLMYSATARDFIYFNPTTTPWENVDINIDLSEVSN